MSSLYDQGYKSSKDYYKDFLVFSPLFPFQATFPCYILQFWHHPYHTRVGQILGTSSCPIQHLPEPSTSSCKAASPLFRYHLHINAVRELAGTHLMWRQQFLQIFVASKDSSLIECLTSNCDAILKNVLDDRTFLLISDLYFRDDFSPRTYFGLSYIILLPSSFFTIPIITLFGHPRTNRHPQTGPWAQYIQF